MRRERIDFVVAGVQKGGTTALHDYLQDHPSLALPATKELHFFDDESQNWQAPDLAGYHAHFQELDGEALLGEATPIYVYWPGSLERIAAYRPDMPLILIFRDPVERAWSHWRMEHARGFDDAPFAWAIREGRARVADDPLTPGFHRVYSYVERGFYAAQLARAYELLGRDRVLCLRSEDLNARPDAVLAHVSAFLGVPAPPQPLMPRRSNVGVKEGPDMQLRDEDRRHLCALFRPDLDAFASLSGLDVSQWAR